jgi:hypothetical protein
MRDRVLAGLGLLTTGLGLPVGFALEAVTRPPGTDGDNAAESLRYLQEHGTAYQLSGVCLVLAALGLLRAATAVSWRTPFLTAVAGVAGGLWAFTGALRISSPGPLEHIAGYDQQWGESAYLVVQMAGTQGGLLSGVVLAAFWVVTGCAVAWRSDVLPKTLAGLGLVGLVYPLLILLSLVGGELPDALWFVAIGSVFLGLPVWCVSTGVWSVASVRRGQRPAGVAEALTSHS